jgi:hypothetical protein
MGLIVLILGIRISTNKTSTIFSSVNIYYKGDDIIIGDSMTKQRIDASPAIIGLIAAIAVVMTSTIVTPAFAITFFFNCMTDIANEHGKLTLDDVHRCLYKEYGVYNKVPYDVFIHSSRGGGGSAGH